MAKKRKQIPTDLKRMLVEEAGHKCANPGCASTLVELHHIRHWAVYKAHQSEHMIAVCPTCHSHVHRGSLRIDDETLYSWKDLNHNDGQSTAHIHVAPAPALKLLAGTIALSSNKAIAVFELSSQNRLSIRVLDGEYLQISAHARDSLGAELLRVSENNIRVIARGPGIKFETRPGRARLQVPARAPFINAWMVNQIRSQEPTYAMDDHVSIFDVEVLEPGVVRIEGFWPSDEGSFVITRERLSFCRPDYSQPLSIMGAGLSTELIFDGTVGANMFNVG